MTERRQPQADASERDRRLLAAISKVQASFISGQQNARTVFQNLLDILLDVAESEYGFVGEVIGPGGDGKPWFRAWAMTDISWDEASRAMYERPGGMMEFDSIDALFAQPLHTHKPVISNDPAHDPRSKGLPKGHRAMDSFLGLPMITGGELVGVAGVANRPGGYDEELANALEPLMATIGAVIVALRADAARERAESALKQSENRYRLAVNGIGAGIWEFDIVNRQVYWSPRLREIFGAPDDFEPTPENSLLRIHPGDKARNLEAYRRHIEDREPYYARLRVERFDGRWIYVDAYGQAEWAANGDPLRMVGSLTDVSDQADAEMRAAMAGLTAEVAVDAAGMGRWRFEPQTGKVTLDRRFVDLVGRPELLGRDLTLYDIIHIADADHQAALAQGMREAGRRDTPRVSFGFSGHRRDGQRFWLQVEGAATRRDDEGIALEYSGIVFDLTELKQAQETADEARRLYELAVSGSGLAIWDWDIKAGTVYASEQYNHMVGAALGSLDPRIDAFLNRVHPDDAHIVQALINGQVDDIQKQPAVLRLVREDGELVWVELAGEARFDETGAPVGMSGTMRDITEQRRVEALARRAGLRAQLALKVANLGVWELDVAQSRISIDRGLAELLQRPDLVETGWSRTDGYEFTHPDDREKVQTSIAALLSGQTEQLVSEHRILNDSGDVIWIKAHIGAMDRDPSGRPGRVIGIVEDLTEQKAAEQAMQAAVERAEAASAAKSQFLANMSHEIRTPLNGVLGIAQLLALSQLDERQQSYVQTIRSSGRALLAIIEDILDLSKIEAGKLTLARSAASPAEVLTEAIAALRPEAGRKGLDLTVEIDPALEPQSLVDANRLRQVVTNLVGNAIKFTDQGQVSVRATRTVKGWLRVEVEDTGPGVAPEVQDQIFGRFHQADMAHNRAHEGAGLGLAIAQELVQLAGGEIGVRSEPGAGACFWFQQPLIAIKKSASPDADTAGKAVADARSQAAEPRRVLVVDDQAVNREVTAEMLRTGGFEPVVATSGAEALARLSEAKVDAVLMDLHMPEMGGDEALQRIRAGETGDPDVPVYIVTADVTVEARDRTRDAKADGYISKPIDIDPLMRTLQCLPRRNDRGAA